MSNRLAPGGAKPVDLAGKQEKRTRPKTWDILRPAPLSCRHRQCMRERWLSCKEAGRAGGAEAGRSFRMRNSMNRERADLIVGAEREPFGIDAETLPGTCARKFRTREFPPVSGYLGMPPMPRTPSVETRIRVESRRITLVEQLRSRRSSRILARRLVNSHAAVAASVGLPAPHAWNDSFPCLRWSPKAIEGDRNDRCG